MNHLGTPARKSSPQRKDSFLAPFVRKNDNQRQVAGQSCPDEQWHVLLNRYTAIDTARDSMAVSQASIIESLERACSALNSDKFIFSFLGPYGFSKSTSTRLRGNE